MRQFKVRWTATFETEVTLEPGQSLADAAGDVHIPEGGGASYVSDTFEVLGIEDVGGKAVKNPDKVTG